MINPIKELNEEWKPVVILVSMCLIILTIGWIGLCVSINHNANRCDSLLQVIRDKEKLGETIPQSDILEYTRKCI